MPIPPKKPPGSVRPELLAPAGDRDCLRAAVENGADAVYFGLATGFNARARATNFTLDELPEVMAFLHHRGVKGYVTLNTLVFPSELPALEEHVRQVALAGTDAVLVQDLGVARLVKAICPELGIHASTQMTLTSAEGIRLAEKLGIERVVLARELSVREIAKIRDETSMPLEAFVHGALCVAYSGQCLTSESLGGRSANRGQCAQACRLPYDLVCDDQPVELGDYKYLLSPQDLAAYDLVEEMAAAGVVSLKIEGRLKTPEYVANITRHYRQAIDAAVAGRPVDFTPQDVTEMELSFSRGFSHGWLDGCNHKLLVEGTSSDKRGVLLGKVHGVERGRVLVELAAAVKLGDGVAFQVGAGDEGQIGGRVYEIFVGRQGMEHAAAGVVALGFKHDSLDLERIQPGQQVWKTDDPELTQRLRKTFTGADFQRRMDVDLTIFAAVGEPLRVIARTATGATCELASDFVLAEAQKHALSEQTLRDQLGRLGGTAFVLRELAAEITGRPMMPFSELGKVRHALVARLDKLTQESPPRTIASQSMLERLCSTLPPRDVAAQEAIPPQIHVLARTLKQVTMLLERDIRSLYVDFQDIRQYAEAVREAQAAGAKIWLATPRIQKPDEGGIFRVLLRHGADGILVRNLGGLLFYQEAQVPVVADFSLNCTNQLTAQLLMERGAERITASYDLNRDQLGDLVSAVPPAWLEVVVHQHMPLFHMEHCVFCAVLSPGTDKTNCGRPCDEHRVELKDRLGVAHPLVADVGCRNTLFNAVPQSAAEAIPHLLAAGLRHFRIELLTDPAAAELDALLAAYRDLLSGRISGKEVWTRLKAMNRVGVTRGTLEERRNPLAIV